MSSKIKQTVTGGIIATTIFTFFTMLAPMMGMPKMSIPGMLSMMLGIPISAGWIMHFMIGLIFAFAYAYSFINVLRKVNRNLLKGVIYGITVFVFAQIMIGIMGMMFQNPPMEGSKALMMLGSGMGHIIYGISLALIIKETVPQKSFAS